jgi:glycosyltransferase involved in cell wall biosynthesis
MNLMVGTDPKGNGGVASAMSLLINEGFLIRNDIRYFVSHAEVSGTKKLFIFLQALANFTLSCVIYRPKIVHVLSSSRSSFIRKSLILGIARLFGCKTIFHLRSGEFELYATKESGALMQWWIRRTLQKSTRLIALTEKWKRFLTEYAPGSDVQVIANAVKLDPLNDSIAMEEGRILFLGQAGAHKGIFELLAAVAQLKKTFPEIRLVVAGDGNLAELQAKANELGISKNIEMLGWIKGDKKNQELARASIFALPSYAEGLPNAMLEAMAAGKAVVATRVGGIPDVVKDGENGLLIPPADINELTIALMRLLENKQLRTTLASNARKTIEESYSCKILIEKLSALYDELLQS